MLLPILDNGTEDWVAFEAYRFGIVLRLFLVSLAGHTFCPRGPVTLDEKVTALISSTAIVNKPQRKNYTQ